MVNILATAAENCNNSSENFAIALMVIGFLLFFYFLFKLMIKDSQLVKRINYEYMMSMISEQMEICKHSDKVADILIECYEALVDLEMEMQN